MENAEMVFYVMETIHEPVIVTTSVKRTVSANLDVPEGGRWAV